MQQQQQQHYQDISSSSSKDYSYQQGVHVCEMLHTSITDNDFQQ
jgi:hypothetical protein